MSETTIELYFASVKDRAVFAAGGPKPQVLIESPMFKAMVVGLEAGQQIPVHPEQASLYYFLEGEGLMTVDGETYRLAPGVTLALPEGARRGINARTRMIFLASKGGA